MIPSMGFTNLLELLSDQDHGLALPQHHQTSRLWAHTGKN